MNKVVIFLLVILAAFSWYLSAVSKEAEKMQATIESQKQEIRNLLITGEEGRQRTDEQKAILEKLRTSAEIEKVRADTAEEILKATQDELARVKALEVSRRDQLDQSEKNLQLLHKQLTEARAEIERLKVERLRKDQDTKSRLRALGEGF